MKLQVYLDSSSLPSFEIVLTVAKMSQTSRPPRRSGVVLNRADYQSLSSLLPLLMYLALCVREDRYFEVLVVT